MQNIEVKNKSKKTIIKNFGVDNPSKSITIQNKKINTNISKFGVDNYSKTNDFRKIMIDRHNATTLKSFSEKLNIDIGNIEIINKDFIKIKNYCTIHDEFIISKDNIYNRINQKIENICTKCNPISENSSIKENEVKEFIKNELNIKTKKIRIENKEIDIYLPDYKLGIEFDGLYHHSQKFKDINYHLNKTEICEKNNIQLLHVFENEWVNKKEIVKSIIKSKLGIYAEKIFARKCQINEVTNNNLLRNFLNTNHLQGFIGSSVKIGLFYNNELVSLMTFGKKRLAMGSKVSIDGEHEMLRFCNKLDTQVIGGASKLLNYFIEIYQPKSILTFADRRYSQGGLYKQLGFEHIGNSDPSYRYYHKHDYGTKHRFNFRKDKLVREGYDKNKSERQIMTERGYLRIYDCGNMRFYKELF